jgi:hypothetical protein
MALRYRDLEWPDQPKKQDKAQVDEATEEQTEES